MEFDHQRLDVYRLALEFVVLADRLVRELPRGRAHLSDQLSRASLSIVLNIAEGAGKVSAGDKRRYYLSARGSATESAALLDVLALVKLATESDHRTGNELLIRIVSMLVKLARSLEERGHGHGHNGGFTPSFSLNERNRHQISALVVDPEHHGTVRRERTTRINGCEGKRLTGLYSNAH